MRPTHITRRWSGPCRRVPWFQVESRRGAGPAAERPYVMRRSGVTVFKIQIFHPESGFYLNTNHESEDLEELKELLQTEPFTGPRFQIVDEEGAVHYGPASRERRAPMSIEDLAKSLGVPVRDSRDLGLLGEDGDA